jgi:Raf kinase inhibitor-like YbhB/YbcL family protein
MYNIPATINTVEEKVNAANINATDGLNSWSEKGYNGPCPPDGTHRYIFTLYALDKTITPKEGMTKPALLEAMKGHILGETTLTGLFRVE